mgnify:FL=1
MLINKGRHKNTQVFTRESIERTEVPHTSLAAGSGLTFGYGLGNYQWLHKGILFHGHGGDADGYLSRYGYTRNNNNGYFVVINAFNHRALSKIRNLLEDYLVKDLERPTTPATKLLSKQQINQLTGTYQNVTTRFGNKTGNHKLSILADGDSLYTRTGNSEKAMLIPVTDEHFRREGETVATIAIVQAADGNIYYQSDHDNFRKVR